jgi:hypothetical protein
MIEFRCWYCDKYFKVLEHRMGEHVTCMCKSVLRVPKTSGGNCRVKTVIDWLVETVIHGGGGAVLGLILAFMIVSQFGGQWEALLGFIPALSLIGFLAGLLMGERGVNWLGQMIREQENR